MSFASSLAIGGYFGLELMRGEGEYHRNVLRFQSARAAFLALLRVGRPAAVWMPWYICDSMLEPLAMEGVPVRRYGLNEKLGVLDAQPGPDEWLLYVNYFGVCGRNVAEMLGRFNPRCVIIDNSHAFFNAAENCLATVYSPRKFLGVPDGGYLVTQQGVPEPTGVDDGSVERCTHLLHRLADEPEQGYASFAAAEASLSMQEPKRMSGLTQTLLGHIPYAEIRARRIKSFHWLHRRLASSNDFPLDLQGNEVPLCYPYLPRHRCNLEALWAKRIYAPRYWAEVVASNEVPAFEARLAQNTLFLPCDQRMGEVQLERQLAALGVEREKFT